MTPDLTSSEAMLAEALGRLRPSLTSRAHAIVRNRADAEDAVQEAAARAWRARSKLRAGADPGPWLKTIVTRVAIDVARDRRQRSGPPVGELPARELSAEDRVVRAEAFTEVSSAAARLAAGPRRVLLLHDLAGLTSHEIAHLDKIPYHTVRTRLRRARESVRNQLQGAI